MRAALSFLAACGSPTFGLDLGPTTTGVVWILEGEEREAQVLEKDDALSFARRVTTEDRATVLLYDRELSGHQLEPGPLELAAPGRPSRPLPEAVGVRVFDPERAEWSEADLPSSVMMLRIVAFDYARCAAVGCLDGDPAFCVSPCPDPTVPALPDSPAPPDLPKDVPDRPVTLACGALVQWYGTDRCVPVDDCPPSGFRTDLPVDAILVLPGEPLYDTLITAPSGRTVAIGAGHYPEEVVVPANVTLVGACTASTSIEVAHLFEGSSIEHLSTRIGLVVEEAATAVRIRHVAATSSITGIEINGEAALERVLVRGGGVFGISVARNAIVSDSVIEGFEQAVVVDGVGALERVAMRASAQAGLNVQRGSVEATDVSIEGAEFAVVLRTSTASLERIGIAGSKIAMDVQTSSASIRGLRVDGPILSSSIRSPSYLALADVEWEGRVPPELVEIEVSPRGRLEVVRGRFRSDAVAAFHTRGGEITLADVDLTGAAIIIDGGSVTADRVEIDGGIDKNCFTIQAGAAAVVHDLRVRGPCPAGALAVQGDLSGERIDIDGVSNVGIQVFGASDVEAAPDIRLSSVFIRNAVTGIAGQRRVGAFEIDRAVLSDLDIGLRAERSSELSVSNLLVDASNRIGIDVDSSALAVIERFALLGRGETGAVIRGTVQADGQIDPLARKGLVLKDGLIGRYDRGVEINAFGFDPAALLDRVTYEADPTIVMGGE